MIGIIVIIIIMIGIIGWRIASSPAFWFSLRHSLLLLFLSGRPILLPVCPLMQFFIIEISWRACQLIFSDRISFNYILILSIQRAIGRTTLAGDNVPNCNDIKKNTFKLWENSIIVRGRMVNTNGLDLKLRTFEFECPMFESPISDHYSCTSVSLLLKSTRPI